MNQNLFGVHVPEEIINRLENSSDEKSEGIKICIELIIEVNGIHLMGYQQEQDISKVISYFR